jgi:hypothetical protein
MGGNFEKFEELEFRVFQRRVRHVVDQGDCDGVRINVPGRVNSVAVFPYGPLGGDATPI